MEDYLSVFKNRPDNSGIDKTCQYCHSNPHCTLYCAKCKCTYYCSRDHQLKDFPIHRQFCVEAVPKLVPESVIDLFKRQDKQGLQHDDYEHLLLSSSEIVRPDTDMTASTKKPRNESGLYATYGSNPNNIDLTDGLHDKTIYTSNDVNSHSHGNNSLSSSSPLTTSHSSLKRKETPFDTHNNFLKEGSDEWNKVTSSDDSQKEGESSNGNNDDRRKRIKTYVVSSVTVLANAAKSVLSYFNSAPTAKKVKLISKEIERMNEINKHVMGSHLQMTQRAFVRDYTSTIANAVSEILRKLSNSPSTTLYQIKGQSEQYLRNVSPEIEKIMQHCGSTSDIFSFTASQESWHQITSFLGNMAKQDKSTKRIEEVYKISEICSKIIQFNSVLKEYFSAVENSQFTLEQWNEVYPRFVRVYRCMVTLAHVMRNYTRIMSEHETTSAETRGVIVESALRNLDFIITDCKEITERELQMRANNPIGRLWALCLKFLKGVMYGTLHLFLYLTKYIPLIWLGVSAVCNIAGFDVINSDNWLIKIARVIRANKIPVSEKLGKSVDEYANRGLFNRTIKIEKMMDDIENKLKNTTSSLKSNFWGTVVSMVFGSLTSENETITGNNNPFGADSSSNNTFNMPINSTNFTGGTNSTVTSVNIPASFVTAFGLQIDWMMDGLVDGLVTGGDYLLSGLWQAFVLAEDFRRNAGHIAGVAFSKVSSVTLDAIGVNTTIIEVIVGSTIVFGVEWLVWKLFQKFVVGKVNSWWDYRAGKVLIDNLKLTEDDTRKSLDRLNESIDRYISEITE